MASDFDVDVSSEEESLSVLKQRADENRKLKKERTGYYDSRDEISVIPEGLVAVKIEAVDEDVSALDDSMTDNDPLASTSRTKKRRRKYPCPNCGAVFLEASELRSHALEHQEETRHKCETCHRCFKKAFSLRMHRKVHEDKELKCPLCDQTFGQKHHLGRHLQSHKRGQLCPDCPAQFHTKEQLQLHSRVHDKTPSKRQRARMKHKEDTDSESEGSNYKKVKSELIDNGSQDYNEFENSFKREELSHSTQCAIVSKMHKGRSVNDICRLYNVTPEVINEIWEEREQYTIPKRNGKKNSRYLNNLLDTRILEWFNKQRASQNQVTGKMLQDIAEDIAKEVGFVAFNGSKKWLDRFKTRYKITLRMTPVKRDLPSAAFDSKWKKAFFKEQWCDARLGFMDENIYTADEVGVYYNPSKGRIKKQAGKKYIHGYVKDRLSIFMCTNVTGSDKKKLLVCGIEDPLIHSHRDSQTLPVNYIRHAQAHFTTKMFEEYVKFWNRELQCLNKKALLIIDRATIHTKMQLSHLKLCFVPWKASVALMPIKNGIYGQFKDEFRKLLLEEKAINVLKGVDRNLTCMEALYVIEKAWDRTSLDVISKSFQICGYDVKSYEHQPVVLPKVKENDGEEICQMLKDFDVEPYYTDITHLDMYLTVDEDLVTGQGTNCSVFGGNHKVIDPALVEKEKAEILPISTEKPETDEREKTVKRNRAMEDLEIVRKYLNTTDTNYEMYCNFMEVESFLFKSLRNLES